MNLTNQLLQDFCENTDKDFDAKVDGYYMDGRSQSKVIIKVRDKVTQQEAHIKVQLLSVMAFVYSKIK